jgi:hypothetical protein
MRKTTMWIAAGVLAAFSVGFVGVPASEAG